MAHGRNLAPHSVWFFGALNVTLQKNSLSNLNLWTEIRVVACRIAMDERVKEISPQETEGTGRHPFIGIEQANGRTVREKMGYTKQNSFPYRRKNSCFMHKTASQPKFHPVNQNSNLINAWNKSKMKWRNLYTHKKASSLHVRNINVKTDQENEKTHQENERTDVENESSKPYTNRPTIYCIE